MIVEQPNHVSRILARMEDLALSKEQTLLNVFAILISPDGDAKTSCNRFVIPLPVLMEGSAFLERRSAAVQKTGPESCVIPRKESWDYLVNLYLEDKMVLSGQYFTVDSYLNAMH